MWFLEVGWALKSIHEIGPASRHSKKTSFIPEQKRRNVCKFSITDYFVSLKCI